MCNYPILKGHYSLLSKLQLKIAMRVKDALLQPSACLKLPSNNNIIEPSYNVIRSLH
jgi:hypothetical protein